MPNHDDDFDTVRQRVLAEFASQGFGTAPLSFEKAIRLRAFAKVRTHLDQKNVAMEQAIWKSLYDGLTEECRKSSPESMREIEELERRKDDLLNFKAAMDVRLNSHPRDFGVQVCMGSLIIGILVGWVRSSTIFLILVHGLAFFTGGIMFCIFALGSAEVQSKISILLYRGVGDNRISYWLYRRALSIRR